VGNLVLLFQLELQGGKKLVIKKSDGIEKKKKTKTKRICQCFTFPSLCSLAIAFDSFRPFLPEQKLERDHRRLGYSSIA
jgi:hypothetical protein